MILASSPSLPIDFVRTQFPALDGYGTFLDNAGGTQMLQSVINRVMDYWLTSNVQLGGSYPLSLQASDRFNAAIEDLAGFIKVTDPSSLVLGGSASLLFRILAHCLAQTWQAGDEVIVTNCDHEANISPWMDLQRQGIVIKTWCVDPDSFCLRVEDLEPLLSDRTRLVAFTHASNILGTINPLEEIVKLAHDRGVQVCVDGVGYAPHRCLSLDEWDVDFYIFSFYKLFGSRQSVLYGKQALLEALPGFNHHFIHTVPQKFQPGGCSYDLTYGNVGICDYFQELGEQVGCIGKTFEESIAECFDLIASHEAELTDRLLSFLQKYPRVRIIGCPEAEASVRVATIAFVVEGQSSQWIPDRLAEKNIGIRYGDFYAKRLIEDWNLTEQNGVIRVSLVHYNTLEEVDRLIEHLTPLLVDR